MRILPVCLALLLLAANGAAALEYTLEVNRVGGNLYHAPAEDLYLETQYCFASADPARVGLEVADGTRGTLTFSASGEQCQVSGFYGPTDLEPGEYTLSVTRADDNWYAIDGQDAVLLTAGCLSLVDSTPGNLQVSEDGSKTLSLPEAGEECSVTGIYTTIEVTLSEQAAE